MSPAQQLRAAAHQADAQSVAAASGSARWKMPGLALAQLLAARARLLDRCAEAFERLGQRVEAPAASDWLDAIVAEEREARRVEDLRYRAIYERFAREADERMRAFLRGGA